MKNLIALALVAFVLVVFGCGGSGGYTSPLSGSYVGTTKTNSSVKIPGVASGAQGTVSITVQSNDNFAATLTYATTTGGTYSLTWTGDAANTIQGNNNAFNATETDAGGPFTGAGPIEVYYHTYPAASSCSTNVTTAQCQEGYTVINMYPNGTVLPPTSTTPEPLFSMVVAHGSNTGTATTTTGAG
jgi:hypothetical protein